MKESLPEYEYDAVIMSAGETGAGAYILFPYDIMECFGKKGQIKVCARFDGLPDPPYRGSLVNMGSGPCIGIKKEIRKLIGKATGDIVHVRIWQDTNERVVAVPDDVQAAFDAHPAQKAFFDSISYTNKRYYIDYIENAKRGDTRQNRIIKIIELLGKGIKNIRKGTLS